MLGAIRAKRWEAWHECDQKQVAEFGLSVGNNKARGGGSAPTCRASIMPGYGDWHLCEKRDN